MSYLEDGKREQIQLFLPFVFSGLQVLKSWPTHIEEGNLFYSVYWFRYSSHPETFS
jgi:hypothetical protein